MKTSKDEVIILRKALQTHLKGRVKAIIIVDELNHLLISIGKEKTVETAKDLYGHCVVTSDNTRDGLRVIEIKKVRK